jgi:hypothetical protein
MMWVRLCGARNVSAHSIHNSRLVFKPKLNNVNGQPDVWYPLQINILMGVLLLVASSTNVLRSVRSYSSTLYSQSQHLTHNHRLSPSRNSCMTCAVSLATVVQS